MKEPSIQRSPDGFSRGSRRIIYRKLFRNGDLFITGLLMMAAFLCNPSTALRTIQFLFFLVYAWLRGNKNNSLITLLVILGIVVFNLLVPYGRVLMEFGGFPITEGSLLGGIHKAVTLEGLIMLSKASIPSDLRLPGSFGSLLGESLRIFQRIADRKSQIIPKHLIQGIDELMLELSAEQESLTEAYQSQTNNAQPRRTLLSILLLGGATVPIFALTIMQFF